MNNALLPNKHLSVADSIIGVGSVIIKILDEPRDLDEIWILYKGLASKRRIYSLEEIVLAIDFLFMIDVIKIDNQGKLSL